VVDHEPDVEAEFRQDAEAALEPEPPFTAAPTSR
jgi:hypothetical protein